MTKAVQQAQQFKDEMLLALILSRRSTFESAQKSIAGLDKQLSTAPNVWVSVNTGLVELVTKVNTPKS